MNRVATLNGGDRRALFAEGTQRLKLLPVVLEKDFWVCWMLGLLFGRPEWSAALGFKGGTALSKVFGIIRRFSEDIDLSVSPGTLGISEAEVNEAGSRRQRAQWMGESGDRMQPVGDGSVAAGFGAGDLRCDRAEARRAKLAGV